jgi:outer membrane protein OmpA-like peptidoglycan-associated protein
MMTKTITVIVVCCLHLLFLAEPICAKMPENLTVREKAREWVDKGLALNDNSLLEASYYQRAAEIDPTYAAAYFNLGFLYQSRNELEKALHPYRQCLRHESTNFDAHYNLAVCLFAVRRDANLYDVRHHLNLAIELKEELTSENQAPELNHWRSQLLDIESRINQVLKPQISDFYTSEVIIDVLDRKITRGGQTIYEGPRLPLILFGTGEVTLSRAHELQLYALANALNSADLASFNFIIEGHADGRGSTAENMELSISRAQSVKDWLVKNGNIDPTRIEIEGFGEDHPIFPNNSSENYHYNRRIEIVRR